MKDPIKVNSMISGGGQPDENDIAALKAAGYRKIINLRRAGEPNQPLDPQAQGDVVARAGLAYAHIPVDPKNLDPSSAAAVAKAIEEADGPVYNARRVVASHALIAEAKAEGNHDDAEEGGGVSIRSPMQVSSLVRASAAEIGHGATSTAGGMSPSGMPSRMGSYSRVVIDLQECLPASATAITPSPRPVGPGFAGVQHASARDMLLMPDPDTAMQLPSEVTW